MCVCFSCVRKEKKGSIKWLCNGLDEEISLNLRTTVYCFVWPVGVISASLGFPVFCPHVSYFAYVLN